MAEPASPQTDALRKQRWAVEGRARVAALPLTARRQAEIVEELSQHLEDHYRELVDSGASPADAAQLALAEFRSGDRFAAHTSGLRQAHTPRPGGHLRLTVVG